MKIIYVKYGVKNYLQEDHRSYIRNFCACEEKAWKKFRLCKPVEYIRGFYPEAIIVARLDASQDTSQTRIDSWQKGYTKGQTLWLWTTVINFMEYVSNLKVPTIFILLAMLKRKWNFEATFLPLFHCKCHASQTGFR